MDYCCDCLLRIFHRVPESAGVRGGSGFISRLKGISMLCLARKKNQKILIGDNIVITVVEVSPGKVVIGIDAPADIAVHRQEVWDAIKKENESGE